MITPDSSVLLDADSKADLIVDLFGMTHQPLLINCESAANPGLRNTKVPLSNGLRHGLDPSKPHTSYHDMSDYQLSLTSATAWNVSVR